MRARALPLAVLISGLVITGTLTWVCTTTHDSNEDRLLALQVRQAASVVTQAIPSVQLPLVSASQLAQATDGDVAQFQSSLGRYVGSRGPFSSASLWNTQADPAQPVAQIGPTSASTPAVSSAVAAAPRTSKLVVQGDLNGSSPQIIYADSASPGSPWVVVAQASLPKNRKLKVAANSAFGNIDYALYLGSTTNPSTLLGASGAVPITSRHATVAVPFGTNTLTLVGTPKGELGGTVLARLPWIVAVVGVVLSFAAAGLTYLLVNRERRAEALADESRELYAEQRGIAETLQHALLPQSLPRIEGIETAARYVAGSDEADVGGDWYEIVPLDDDHFVFALGDVSGRGVEAASSMARLSHAIEAYSLDTASPTTIMQKVVSFFGSENGMFATVVCGLVDVPRHEVILVNAGHPEPMLITSDGAKFVPTVINPPVGLNGAGFEATTISVPPKGTLVAFTDGLFERRGEVLDVGLNRLLSVASGTSSLTLESVLDGMVEGAGAGGSDDTALLGIRWKS